MNPRQLSIRLFVFLALPMLLALAGCVVPPPITPTPTSVTGELLPFESIFRISEACVDIDGPAKLFFATTSEEYEHVVAQLPPPPDSRLLEKYQHLDLTGKAAVAVIRRCQGSASNTIQVSRIIRQEDGSLVVYAALQDVAPGHGSVGAEGSSYHIVTIPWNGPDAAQTKVTLVTYLVYY